MTLKTTYKGIICLYFFEVLKYVKQLFKVQMLRIPPSILLNMLISCVKKRRKNDGHGTRS